MFLRPRMRRVHSRSEGGSVEEEGGWSLLNYLLPCFLIPIVFIDENFKKNQMKF